MCNTNLTKTQKLTRHTWTNELVSRQHARRGEFYVHVHDDADDDDDDARMECRRVAVRVRVPPDACSIDDKDDDECEDENEERINHDDCVTQSNE